LAKPINFEVHIESVCQGQCYLDKGSNWKDFEEKQNNQNFQRSESNGN